MVEDKSNEMTKNHEKMKENELLGDFDSPERAEEYEKRYNLAKEFYSKFSKKSAVEAIQKNEALKNLLGPKYLKLLGEIGG